VVPSSTQFLPLNRTESVSFHHFNQRVFQQNRPIATSFSLGPDVSFRREAEVGRAAEFAASVENDPRRTWLRR
jgi:hypothetical protein